MLFIHSFRVMTGKGQGGDGVRDREQETAKAGMKLPMALRSKGCVDRFEWGEARRYFRNLCLHLVPKRGAWIGPDGKRRVLLTEDDGWVSERSIPPFICKTPGFCLCSRIRHRCHDWKTGAMVTESCADIALGGPDDGIPGKSRWPRFESREASSLSS